MSDKETIEIHFGFGEVAITAQSKDGDPRKAITFYELHKNRTVGDDLVSNDMGKALACLVFYNAESLEVLAGAIEKVRELFEGQNENL